MTSPLCAGTAARLPRSRSCAHIPAAAKQFFGPSLPVMLRSALLNVMIKAAQKAARALKRDFGEVEHLQVSLKGPANFVSAADHRAEQTLREELERLKNSLHRGK